MPSGGELSKVSFTGPSMLVACPVRPALAPERPLVDRHALDHRALRDPLGQLVAQRRHRRVVGDPACERRRHRHDRPPRVDFDAVRMHRDAVRLVGDPPNRRVEHDTVAQLLRHADRDQLRPADHARVLRAALGVEQRVEARRPTRCRTGRAAARGPRAAPPRPPRRQRQRLAGALRVDVAPHPRPQRLAVPLLRLRRGPTAPPAAPSSPSGRASTAPGRSPRAARFESFGIVPV